MTDNWHISLNSHWISGRERALSDTRPTIDDYTLVNLSSSYVLNEGIVARFSAKNLTDKSIFEPSTGSISNDYLMPGRSVWLELEYTIKQ